METSTEHAGERPSEEKIQELLLAFRAYEKLANAKTPDEPLEDDQERQRAKAALMELLMEFPVDSEEMLASMQRNTYLNHLTRFLLPEEAFPDDQDPSSLSDAAWEHITNLHREEYRSIWQNLMEQLQSEENPKKREELRIIINDVRWLLFSLGKTTPLVKGVFSVKNGKEWKRKTGEKTCMHSLRVQKYFFDLRQFFLDKYQVDLGLNRSFKNTAAVIQLHDLLEDIPGAGIVRGEKRNGIQKYSVYFGSETLSDHAEALKEIESRIQFGQSREKIKLDDLLPEAKLIQDPETGECYLASSEAVFSEVSGDSFELLEKQQENFIHDVLMNNARFVRRLYSKRAGKRIALRPVRLSNGMPVLSIRRVANEQSVQQMPASQTSLQALTLDDWSKGLVETDVMRRYESLDLGQIDPRFQETFVKVEAQAELMERVIALADAVNRNQIGAVRPPKGTGITSYQGVEIASNTMVHNQSGEFVGIWSVGAAIYAAKLEDMADNILNLYGQGIAKGPEAMLSYLVNKTMEAISFQGKYYFEQRKTSLVYSSSHEESGKVDEAALPLTVFDLPCDVGKLGILILIHQGTDWFDEGLKSRMQGVPKDYRMLSIQMVGEIVAEAWESLPSA